MPSVMTTPRLIMRFGGYLRVPGRAAGLSSWLVVA